MKKTKDNREPKTPVGSTVLVGTRTIYPAGHPVGEVIERDGAIYWEGNEVKPCGLCGMAAVCVDDCGEFGNELCPRFGKVGSKACVPTK